MDVSRMIAEVGGIVNVSGSRIATPFAPPSPGSTPMMVPSTMPITAIDEVERRDRDLESEEEVLDAAIALSSPAGPRAGPSA